jgi:hypothetical protein
MIATTLTRALMGALLASTAATLWARPPVDAEQIALEKEATELIEHVAEVGHDVLYHGERLAQLARDPAVSEWTHFHHLDGIKAEINNTLRPALARLTEIQKRLPDWKQESVDRMMAAARALSEDTSSAFFSSRNNLRMPAVMNEDYGRLVRDVSAHAATLVKTADAAHEYAVAHLKAAAAGLPVKK